MKHTLSMRWLLSSGHDLQFVLKDPTMVLLNDLNKLVDCSCRVPL